MVTTSEFLPVVAFTISRDSRFRGKLLLLVTRPEPISEGSVPGDETPVIIFRREISRQMVAYATSTVGRGSMWSKSLLSLSRSSFILVRN